LSGVELGALICPLEIRIYAPNSWEHFSPHNQPVPINLYLFTSTSKSYLGTLYVPYLRSHMATAYKILGQVATSTLGATTEGTLFTSTGVETIVSSLVIANQAGSSATYRIAVQPSADTGSSAADKHWIVYGATVAASDSVILTVGLTLASGDRIRVYGSTATMSFSAYGSQIS